MYTGIERTFVTAFVNAHTPLVTSEQFNKLFLDLATTDVKVEVVSGDFNLMSFTGIVSSTARRFIANNQHWLGSDVNELILADLLYTGTLQEFLAETDNALVYVDSTSGIVYIPHTSDTELTEAEVLALMGYATGFDFTDLNTIQPAMHSTNLITKSNISNPPAGLEDRIEGTWEINGLILKGTVYFINAFIPVTDSMLLTEDGDYFVTEDGSRLILE